MTILAAYPLSKSDLKGRHVFLVLITITMYVGAGIVPNYLLVKRTASDEYGLGSGPARNDQSVQPG